MSQPQPPLDERGEAHEALTSAVTSYGPRILQNSQMLGNVVTDLLPDLPREQNLLIAAAEADVATDLHQNIRDRNLDMGTAVQLTAHSLAGKKSIDPAASMWVTTEYARALGYNVPPYTSQSVPPPAPPPVPPPQQSVPPPQQSVPPPQQSVPPWPPPQWQSVPPGSQVPDQSIPPGGGYGGGAPGGPWVHGPVTSAGPAQPTGSGGRNRGIIIAIASGAAVIVLAIVAVSAHAFGGGSKPVVVSTHSTHPPQVHSTPPSPTSTDTGQDNRHVANAIADLVVGNGSLGVLTTADGTTATRAICDPRTVSNPPDPATPTTASCDITYSDGTVWQQTVTVTFDSSGEPVSDSTNSGTQIG